MGDFNNEGDGGLVGKLYESSLYLLFLRQGCLNKYRFKLRREQKDAGKFDDLVFEYEENGAKVYKIFQAKHTVKPGQTINDDHFFSGGKGDFDLVKYFLSYRKAKKSYSGKVMEFSICTNKCLCKKLKTDIEEATEEDNILDIVKENGKKPERYHVEDTPENVDRFKDEWKKRKTKWESRKDKRSSFISSEPEPETEEIKDYFKALTFAVDMPNQKELGIILKNEIGEQFCEIRKEDIYNRAFMRMIDWMSGNDRRDFWTHKDAEALFEDVKTGFALPYDVRYNIEPPVSVFTGRQEQLEWIHNSLQEEKQAMICGLGGIGKTELVRKYIKEHSDKYYNNILWINTENDQTLKNCFHSLAFKLGIKTKDEKGEEKAVSVVVGEVYQWFQQSKSLFIFDNAEWERFPSYIRPSLSKGVREPYIIITSRRKLLNINFIKCINLSVFAESEATKFISDSLSEFLKNDPQVDSVKKLGETLQYLPLALQQAVAYIIAEFEDLEDETETYQISEYTENFSKKSMEYLDYDLSDYSESGYAMTVWTTWNITVEALQSKEDYTLDVLSYMSFLRPDNIHADLLSRLLCKKEKLKKAKRLLKKYLLIIVRDKVYSLHRLVQLVTREKLEKDRKRDVLENILGAIVENDETTENSVDHFTSAWMHFKENCSELVNEYYHIPAKIASILFKIERHNEAHVVGVEALKLIKPLPLNNAEEQKYVQNIAPIIVKFFCNSGECEEALDKSKKILNILNHMNVLFPYTLPILSVARDIATIYLHKGDVNSAVEVSKNITDPSVYVMHNGMTFLEEFAADILLEWFGYTVTLSFYRPLFNKRKTTNDPDTLRMSKKIANVLSEMRIYEKANNVSFKKIDERSEFANKISSILEAYEVERNTLLDDHNDRLYTQESIINIRIEQEKYEEALALFQEIPYLRLVRNNCSLLAKKAAVLALLGKNDDALDICKELDQDVSKLESADFKKNYADIVTRRVNIALVMSLLRKFDVKILEEVWDRLKYSVGFYNLHVANILEMIGYMCYRENKHAEGLNAFEEAWQCFPSTPDFYFKKFEGYHMFLKKFWMDGLFERLELSLSFIHFYVEKLDIDRLMGLCEGKRNLARTFYHRKDYNKALSIMTEVKKSLDYCLIQDSPYYQETCRILCFISNKIESYENESEDVGLSNAKDPFDAVKSGNLALLKKLIKEGVCANHEDENGWTLLHHAANANEPKIVEYLLQKGADVTRVTEKNNNTALHIAVTSDLLTVAEVLLDLSFDKLKMFINAKTKQFGNTALHIASSESMLQMVRLLLSRGAAYDIKNEAGESPMEMTKDLIVRGVLKEVHMRFQYFQTLNDDRALEPLKNYPEAQYIAVFGARNSEGYNLLQLAVTKNHKNLVDLILGFKFRIDFRITSLSMDDILAAVKDVSNALHNNRISSITYSSHIRRFVEMIQKVGKGTLLKFFMYAIEDMLDLFDCDGHSDELRKLAKYVVEVLVERLVKISYGWVLVDAARLGDLATFELCLGKGSHLGLSDQDGMTALHHAAAGGDEAMVKLLLDKNARIRCMNVARQTPLHLAAENGCVEVAELLLQRDSNRSFVDSMENSGSTALHLAAKNGHLRTVQLLLWHRACYVQESSAGLAPADLAEKQEVKDLLELIHELHTDSDEERVLERLKNIEPAERGFILNAANKKMKGLLQVILAKCEDVNKVLDAMGLTSSQSDSDSLADLTRKLLDIMLKVAEKYENK